MSLRQAKPFSVTLIVTAPLIYPAGPALGESVMLKRQYVPGATSYIERQMEVDQDISGLPMPPMKFHVEQLYGVWEKIDSVTGNKASVVLTYDRAARKVNAPMMGEVEFDTDDPEYEEAAPQLGAVLKPMIGMAMAMEVNQDGKVISFSGMDAIHKKISAEAVASMHWAQMQEEFTNERGQETWGREPLLIYPNKEVKVGDTWTASSTMERPRIGTIVTDYQYKVDRIGMEKGRKIISISVTGVVSKGADVEEETESKAPGSTEDGKKEDDAEKEEAKTAELETEIKGTLSGTASYDAELGYIVRRNTEGNVDIRIPLAKLMPDVPTGEEPQFASFKTAIKSTTSILTEKQRNTQKAEARKKAELRRKAEEEEDDEEDDEEEDDE